MAPVRTMAGVVVLTNRFKPAVTRGPIRAVWWLDETVSRETSAGREKNEMMPAKTMPMATNVPSCRIGWTSVTSNEKNPAAVEIVVRIIGTPTWRRAEATRSVGLAFKAASSWKWVTKCSPSAEPITITKIGTMTVTMST